MRRIVGDERGFSLTELLVVTAVLGLIMSGVFLVQQKGQEAYTMGSNRVEAQQNARMALDLMTAELRTAQSLVTLGGASNVTFRDQDDTQIQYQLSGSTLNRISGGVTTPIIGGVVSLTLTYCKVWNAATNTCTTAAAAATDVTVIRIELVAKTESTAATGSLGYRSMTVESAIRLRNIN